MGIAAGSEGTARSPRWEAFPRTASLRHLARMRLAEHPRPYLQMARRRYPGPSPEVVGPTTELVIDGYTRSATTFAVYAFQLAQPEPVRLAHHLHAPAQLEEAAARGVPALALIREPEGAILSQVVQEPDVPLRVALTAYSRFYERLMPFRDRLVAGVFDELTADPGVAIARVNARFGTSFAVPDDSKETRERCLALMRERPTPIARWSSALLWWESGVLTHEELQRVRTCYASEPAPAGGGEAWVPSRDRAQAKAALRLAWEDTRLRSLRRRAQDAFDRFVAEEAGGSVRSRTV